MNGANGTTSVAGVLDLPLGNRNVPPPPPPPSGRPQAAQESLHVGVDGALASGKKTLAESLASSGFIDPSGSLLENLAMYVKYRPAEEEVGDLKPGALRDLVSWVQRELAAQAEQSTQIQAHVSPEAALKLLT